MLKVRLYNDSDYPTIRQWWADSNEPAPEQNLIPSTTYILLDSGEPVMSISVIFTSIPQIAVLENFIKKNSYHNKHASEKLVRFVERVAKASGCKILVCLSYKDRLKERYQELGYRKTVDNLSSFIKQI